MIKSKELSIFVVVFHVIASFSAARAEDSDVFRRIADAYQRRDFAQAVRLGKLLKDSNENTANALYLVGNSLLQLGHLAQAEVHYKACLRISPKSEAAKFADQALKRLDGFGGRYAETAGNPNPSLSNQLQERVERQEMERREAKDKENFHGLIRKQSDYDTLIKRVNEETQNLVDAVPKQIRSFRDWVPNPDYDHSVSEIRAEAAVKLAPLQREAAHIKKDLDALTVKMDRAKNRDNQSAEIMSQIRPGKSLIQMTPTGSNLYVRNYVNFTGEPEETPPKPLVGTIKKLNLQDASIKIENKTSRRTK